MGRRSPAVLVNTARLRAIMHDRHWSTSDLAYAMGFKGPGYLYVVLRGKRGVGAQFIMGLIRAGIDPKEVIEYSPATEVHLSQR